MESESIIDCIIWAENISNDLKEAEEVLREGLLIARVLKGLSSNFKLFTMIKTEEKNTLTFSEFKVRGSLNKFPDFLHMGTFIDGTHMKL